MDDYGHVVYCFKESRSTEKQALLYRCLNCRVMMIVETKGNGGGYGKVLYCGKENNIEKDGHLPSKLIKVLHGSETLNRIKDLTVKQKKRLKKVPGKK